MRAIEIIRKKILEERRQYKAWFALSVLAGILTVIIYLNDPSVFLRFTGSTDPLLVWSAAVILGFFLFLFPLSRTNFKIYEKQRAGNYFIIFGIAVLFGLEVIAADIWLVDYQEDINVVFPKSLVFYPAIGFIAEVFFHLVPISIITFALLFFRKLSINKIMWISILMVSVMEPVYQYIFTSESSLTTSVYTAIHVLLFSLTQLIIFKRMDFISMYFFRIVFYVIWHMVWGYLRLNLIF